MSPAVGFLRELNICAGFFVGVCIPQHMPLVSVSIMAVDLDLQFEDLTAFAGRVTDLRIGFTRRLSLAMIDKDVTVSTSDDCGVCVSELSAALVAAGKPLDITWPAQVLRADLAGYLKLHGLEELAEGTLLHFQSGGGQQEV
jgi:hypothetical protein